MRKRTCEVLFFVVALSWMPWAFAIDLSGTIFDKAGKMYGLDPKLIYSVALVESASNRGGGTISPWPWTLRSSDKPFYAQDQKEAESTLTRLQEKMGTSIDVGLMQINLRWHCKDLASAVALLDPETNIMKGVQILTEAIKSAPHDLELGIGRYHNWTNEARARNYGSRVRAIYANLSTL